MSTAFVLVTDKRGYALAEHAAAVAMVTQKGTRNIVIFCVGFPGEPEGRLAAAAVAQGFSLTFRSLTAGADTASVDVSKGYHSHVSGAALLKFHALEALRDEFGRAMYIDSDILLMEDVKIEGIDFEGHPIAAVYDIGMVGALHDAADFYEICKKSGRSPHYFNSGMIVADYAKWRDDFVGRYERAIEEHDKGCGYRDHCSSVDQCALNIIFERSWKRLPLSMNLQSTAMFSKEWNSAIVRHYVGKAKFIPYKAWRNDGKDARLLNRARSMLGLLPIGGYGWPRLVRMLNVMRHRMSARGLNDGFARIASMYAEEMGAT